MSVHSNFRKASASVIGVLAATILVACGGGDAGPQSRQFTMNIEHRAIDLDSGVISVTQGDHVTLKFSADEKGLVHLHGYDLEQEVAPGQPTIFEFVADATGRYNFTFHAGDDDHEEAEGDGEGQHEDEKNEEDEVTLGALEVRPR